MIIKSRVIGSYETPSYGESSLATFRQPEVSWVAIESDLDKVATRKK